MFVTNKNKVEEETEMKEGNKEERGETTGSRQRWIMSTFSNLILQQSKCQNTPT
jgi:hypothetical protein